MKAEEDKLPQRPPAMLFQIIGKFYRGAVSHYALLQEMQQKAQEAFEQMRVSGDASIYQQVLFTLFHEYHFYTTCWRQIDMALYRLTKQDETKSFAQLRSRHEQAIQRHLLVRHHLSDIEGCVNRHLAATTNSQQAPACYLFGEVCFCVDEDTLGSLHQLYRDVMEERLNWEQQIGIKQ